VSGANLKPDRCEVQTPIIFSYRESLSFDDFLHQGDGADDALKPEKLARSATPE
jgi:hypothetical protein